MPETSFPAQPFVSTNHKKLLGWLIVVILAVAAVLLLVKSVKQDEQYAAKEWATQIVEANKQSNIVTNWSNKELKCVDELGERLSLDPEPVFTEDLDILATDSAQTDIAQFAVALLDDCFDDNTRLDILAGGLADAGTNVSEVDVESAKCIAGVLGSYVSSVGGYKALYEDSEAQENIGKAFFVALTTCDKDI